MGLFDSIKNRRKKKKDAGVSPEELRPLDVTEAAEPPETRYTLEYQEFLAAQEAAQEDGTREAPRAAEEAGALGAPQAAEEEEPAAREYPAVSPEGFCARFERCDSSLIEEPESCEVCVFFSDRDETCRHPERMQ